jgi:hypothetical protein
MTTKFYLRPIECLILNWILLFCGASFAVSAIIFDKDYLPIELFCFISAVVIGGAGLAMRYWEKSVELTIDIKVK